MAAPRITLDDLGAYFAGPDDTLWKLVSYAADPTATLERVYPPQPAHEQILGKRPYLLGGVVGAPIFDGFVRLVRDGGDSERLARCAYPGCPSTNDELRPVGRILSEGRETPELVFSCHDHVNWLKDRASGYVAFDLGATA